MCRPASSSPAGRTTEGQVLDRCAAGPRSGPSVRPTSWQAIWRMLARDMSINSLELFWPSSKFPMMDWARTGILPDMQRIEDDLGLENLLRARDRPPPRRRRRIRCRSIHPADDIVADVQSVGLLRQEVRPGRHSIAKSLESLCSTSLRPRQPCSDGVRKLPVHVIDDGIDRVAYFGGILASLWRRIKRLTMGSSSRRLNP